MRPLLKQPMFFVQRKRGESKRLDQFASTIHIQVDSNLGGAVCRLDAVGHLCRGANIPDALERIMSHSGDTAGEQFRLSEETIEHTEGGTRRKQGGW